MAARSQQKAQPHASSNKAADGDNNNSKPHAAAAVGTSPLNMAPHAVVLRFVALLLGESAWATAFYCVVAWLYVPVTQWWQRSSLVGAYDGLYFAIGTTITHGIAYALFNAVFFTCDEQKALQEYKLARKPHQNPSYDLIRKTLKQAAMSFVSSFVQLLVLHRAFVLTGSTSDPEKLPSVFTTFWQLMICSQFNDFAFYWAHRLLHHPSLYKRFHKQHHEYVGTISLSAEYAHPLEQFLANGFPTIGGAMIFGFHFAVWWTWLVVRLFHTYVNHSGYCFEGTWAGKIHLVSADPASHHDFHHTNNKGNYGSEFFDWLFGTMQPYIDFRATGGKAKHTDD